MHGLIESKFESNNHVIEIGKIFSLKNSSDDSKSQCKSSSYRKLTYEVCMLSKNKIKLIIFFFSSGQAYSRQGQTLQSNSGHFA